MNKDRIIDTDEAMDQIEDPTSIQNKDTKEKEEFWKKKALYDPLTKLPNRFASDLIVESIKYDCEWFAIIDIDHFKEVNDTYGHQAGDEVLKKLAGFLDERLIATRFGGEEFTCFLVGEEFKTKESTEEYLNELREEVSKLTFDKVDKSINISIGVTEFYREERIATLFKEADKALYCAKDYGRNQVVFYEEGMDCEAHSDDGKEITKNNKCNLKENKIMKIKRIKRLIESLNESEMKQLSRILNEVPVKKKSPSLGYIIYKDEEGELYTAEFYFDEYYYATLVDSMGEQVMLPYPLHSIEDDTLEDLMFKVKEVLESDSLNPRKVKVYKNSIKTK